MEREAISPGHIASGLVTSHLSSSKDGYLDCYKATIAIERRIQPRHDLLAVPGLTLVPHSPRDLQSESASQQPRPSSHCTCHPQTLYTG